MCDRACGLESDKDSALRKKVLLKLSEEVSQCVCMCVCEREREIRRPNRRKLNQSEHELTNLQHFLRLWRLVK